MKKKLLLLLPTVILCLMSAYIFLVGVYGRGWNREYILIAFLVSILVNFLYYLWLVITKRIGTKLTVFYIPISTILFVLFIHFILSPPYRRDVNLNLGEDPFAPGTTISGGTRFYFWEPGFYSLGNELKNREEKRKAEMRITRQGSLIGHVGTDLKGWSAEKIKNAFGEPRKILQLNENLEKWIYYPWTNHTDWEMPVYVQNKMLLKIGD